jgi:hypothetical protein
MDERPQRRGSEKMLGLPTPKGWPGRDISRSTRRNNARRSCGKVTSAPGHPIRGSRSPEKKLSWAMLSGHGTILTTCGISEWWAGKSARRHFPYWMKCLRSPMNPPATWKSRPDLPSFSTVVFLGARSTSSSRLLARRKVLGFCFGRVILRSLNGNSYEVLSVCQG